MLPPESWALAGVVLGTLIPAAMGAMNARLQSKHEANRTLIESLERRLHDMEESLKGEMAARRELEAQMKTVQAEARAAQEESWRRHDRAQLIVSRALTHIERLERHIEAGSPPPPPPLPSEIQDIANELIVEHNPKSKQDTRRRADHDSE